MPQGDFAVTILMRLAKGIHASLSGAASIEADVAWEGLPVEARSPYVTAAIRMLMILRAPTDQMLADGNAKGVPDDAANVWERMIFRALHEEA